MVIFVVLLFLTSIICFLYISHKKIIKIIDEDEIIISDENYKYIFQLYSINGNKSVHEISSNILKYFGINHFINEYKNAYELVHKNDKIIKIELYISENCTVKHFLKTYEITN